jgi:hypothetical protein
MLRRSTGAVSITSVGSVLFLHAPSAITREMAKPRAKVAGRGAKNDCFDFIGVLEGAARCITVDPA